jgi:hypothetical protein
MRKHLSSWFGPATVALLCVASVPAAAQPDNVNFRFTSGQPVQPIYEGWQRSAEDGTVSMYFGYINRNYAQELAIPVGPSNSFAPGPVDRGQPTLFAARIHRQMFSVTLPVNWSRTQELVWTVTANGATLKAVGWLQPEWEIDAETAGQMRNEDARANRAPTLKVHVPAKASVAERVELQTSIIDDGLPKPRSKPAPIAGVAPPTLSPDPADPEIPVNVPEVTDPGRGGRRPGSAPGLTVKWIAWRGPASVSFEPQTAQVKDGEGAVRVRFREPGTYVLRAIANDGLRSSDFEEVTISVSP